jgi:hypothetical protein
LTPAYKTDMAIVRAFERRDLEAKQKHTETFATFTWIQEPDGRYLQIDTYGSDGRAIPGKKSQSLRLAPSALHQLRALLDDGRTASASGPSRNSDQ